VTEGGALTEIGTYFNELSLDQSETVATKEQEETERLLVLEAGQHVTAAWAQRALLNYKVEKAQEDTTSAVAHGLRTHTLVVDYGQNMAMPWFGADQPGEVYYYTPMSIYNLGVVDTARVKTTDPIPDRLYAHVYHEGQGAKGSDNVASLIMKTLKTLGWLDQICPGHELNIVFDLKDIMNNIMGK
jgi:hypothetical protein